MGIATWRVQGHLVSGLNKEIAGAIVYGLKGL